MARLTTTQLNDIEDIKVLKARYARLLDSQDWCGLRDIFSEDCVLERTMADGCVELVEGVLAILEFLKPLLVSRTGSSLDKSCE
jgi:hypothetical protein